MASQKPAKKLTIAEAKQKIYTYCAYQERTHQEVKNRLFQFGLHSNEVDELLSHLIIEGYLNEERFAKAFAGGKFRVKKWGRLKIMHELEARGLTINCIRSGMKEIEESDYTETLETLLTKKADLLTDKDSFVKRDKLAKYGIYKGYESELVWKYVKNIVSE
jgi:regulatory protein